MKMAKTIEEYVNDSPWNKEIETLRSIFHETELAETLKWGIPNYTLDEKIVASIAGFKSYVGIWFHNGVFLKDPHKTLINAGEGNTRGQRQWRFNSIDEMNKDWIKAYILEAIANQKAGREIKPEPKKMIIGDELNEALASDSSLSEAFEELTIGKRKEYAEYVSSAKQEKTRLSRLEKVIPMIKSGVGLNDKYR